MRFPIQQLKTIVQGAALVIGLLIVAPMTRLGFGEPIPVWLIPSITPVLQSAIIWLADEKV